LKIFIIDWSNISSSELITKCQNLGHEINFELHDGAVAYRIIGELKPDLILINYDVKPSHGKSTAEAIKQRKSTANIPLYFVTEKSIADKKLNALGEIISKKNLPKILSHFRD
jgi:DNA-binding response OmpR family regulator